MIIRPFRESDEASVVALSTECELTRPWNDPHKDIARKLAVQRELFLVGTDDEKIVRASNTGVLEFYRELGYAQDEALALGKRLIPDTPSP
jgi:histone acetyltransferase (RNA polymerase elongator complex component)